AFLLNLGLETMAVRMKQYCENAMTVAKYLQSVEQVESVCYPGLEGDENYALANKYLKGCSGVISFVLKGGKEPAVKFMNSLKLASNEVHVADIRTCVLHPASETHRQLSDEQLAAAGIESGMVRFSVGLENVDDIIADLENAFAAIG
ncbi:MAG: PLP-dependent transferase, partial [Clostridiales bacterium]|nr:PLP-dependent transferase [Clostridiales bacterium]